MGKQSRLHRLAVIAGKALPFRQAAEAISHMDETTREKAADFAASKMMRKMGISSDLSQANIARACRQLSKVIDSRSRSILDIRSDITRGMYKETATLMKEGMTKEQVFEHYWTIPEFQPTWTKLGFGKEHLNAILGIQGQEKLEEAREG